MQKPAAISYAAVFTALILIAWLQLATPFIAVLFCYLLLNKLCFLKKKWIAVLCFLLLMGVIFYGFVFFLKRARVELPKIVTTAIPAFAHFAEQHGIDLPFTDMDSLKDMASDSVRETLGYLVNFAKIATKEFFFLAMGVVVAIGIFLNPEIDHEKNARTLKANLYDLYTGLIAERFRSLYRSFERVMGAQLIISTINAALTAVFVNVFSLRYASIVIILTFLCGLLPIVGNLISNTIIVGIAFSTVSPKFAAWTIVFLIAIHKLEYFLNSKIIGSAIRHPMWLTMLGLIVGERVMGIPGLILAPVVLHFIKIEASQIEVAEPRPQSALEKK